MPIQVGFQFDVTLLRKRDVPKLMNAANRFTGYAIRNYVTPKKFTMSAYSEYPGIVRRRSTAYNRRKMRRVGHTIPNVLTGETKSKIIPMSTVTATSSGGRLVLRSPWSGKGKQKRDGTIVRQGWKEAQRQEHEAMNDRDRDRITREQERFVRVEMRKPEYQRKRSLRRSKV